MGIFSGKLYPKIKVFRVKEKDFKRNKNPERLITEGQYATVRSVSIPDHPFFFNQLVYDFVYPKNGENLPTASNLKFF